MAENMIRWRVWCTTDARFYTTTTPEDNGAPTTCPEHSDTAITASKTNESSRVTRSKERTSAPSRREKRDSGTFKEIATSFYHFATWDGLGAKNWKGMVDPGSGNTMAIRIIRATDSAVVVSQTGITTAGSILLAFAGKPNLPTGDDTLILQIRRTAGSGDVEVTSGFYTFAES